jgi:drug/metabolite transporter (DMT)-like permease
MFVFIIRISGEIMQNKNRLIYYIFAIIAMLSWGSTFIWFKIVFKYYQPLTVTFLRLLLATIMLFLFSILVKKNERISKEDRKYFLLLTFFEPFCYFLGESFGMQYVNASLGSIIISTIPLVTPIFAFLFLKEEITKFGIIGLVVSFLGVLLIVLGESMTNSSLKGILLMFFAVLSAVGYGIVVRNLADRYSSITIVKWQSFIGMLLFLPLFVTYELRDFVQVNYSWEASFTILKLAFFGSVLAFIMMTKVVRGIGLNSANMFTNLIPVITSLLSYFILKEIFGMQKIIGIGIVILGLFISQIPHIIWHEKIVKIFNGFY